jgi:hypothetical protein
MTGRPDSDNFVWGTMTVANAEIFLDLDGNECVRGRVIVTEVNHPSYVENVAIYANEFSAFKQLILPEDEQ